MPVFELYSHLQRAAEGGLPDVFNYEEIPNKLRVQIIYIWNDAIGGYHVYSGLEFGRNISQNNSGWHFIHNKLAREYGVLSLGNDASVQERCTNYLLNNNTLNNVLDLIQVSFYYIDKIARKFTPYDRKKSGISMTADNAIKELNERFHRAGVGYRFEDGMIFRVDSDLMHHDVVKPALHFLQQPGFNGPREEFLQAHGHYRAGEMKDAITDANNAFESTLKSICDQRGWQYQKSARASDLIRLVRSKGLLPNYLENSFEQLVATLKSGLPKVRNEEGAHGQGASPRETPDYVAAYAIHLAAAKILFLAEAHKAMD